MSSLLDSILFWSTRFSERSVCTSVRVNECEADAHHQWKWEQSKSRERERIKKRKRKRDLLYERVHGAKSGKIIQHIPVCLFSCHIFVWSRTKLSVAKVCLQLFVLFFVLVFSVCYHSANKRISNGKQLKFVHKLVRSFAAVAVVALPLLFRLHPHFYIALQLSIFTLSLSISISVCWFRAHDIQVYRDIVCIRSCLFRCLGIRLFDICDSRLYVWFNWKQIPNKSTQRIIIKYFRFVWFIPNGFVRWERARARTSNRL